MSKKRSGKLDNHSTPDKVGEIPNEMKNSAMDTHWVTEQLSSDLVTERIPKFESPEPSEVIPSEILEQAHVGIHATPKPEVISELSLESRVPNKHFTPSCECSSVRSYSKIA